MKIQGQGQTKRGAQVDYLEVKTNEYLTYVMAGLSTSRRAPIDSTQLVWFIFD